MVTTLTGGPNISAKRGGGGLNATPFVRLAEFFVTAQSRKAQNFQFAKKCRVFPSFCRMQGAIVCAPLFERNQAKNLQREL